MNDKQVKRLAMGGVMAALVFVMTYLPKVPVPVTGGYVHLGDGMVFLAAMLLGPVGVAAAAVGSALSDLVGGYMTYLLPTFVIKGAMALVRPVGTPPGNSHTMMRANHTSAPTSKKRMGRKASSSA